jgi:serine protease AprX
MAAPIVAGIAADLLSAHPAWTPDQVKGALTANLRPTRDGGGEVAADVALSAPKPQLVANQGLTPSSFIDPATGSIDYTRASWSRASWSAAADGLRASWAAASWTCDCATLTSPSADPARASWARASWARASWASFFTETPDAG